MANMVGVPRLHLPAGFDIEAYLHATLAKRICMIDGAMGTMVQKHRFVSSSLFCTFTTIRQMNFNKH